MPRYLSVDAVGLLAAAVEQGPALVAHVAHVHVVAVALAERDAGAAEHQQVVAVENRCEKDTPPHAVF